MKVSAILGVEIGIGLKTYGMYLKMLFCKMYIATLYIVLAVGGYSAHSLQVESGFSVEYNEEKVKITSNG